MKFSVPIKPISLNAMIRSAKGGRIYLNTTYRECKNSIFRLLKSYYLSPPLNDYGLSVKIVYHLIDRRKFDVDNHAKVILDACKGVLFTDDNLITKLVLIKKINANYTQPYFELFIDEE